MTTTNETTTSPRRVTFEQVFDGAETLLREAWERRCVSAGDDFWAISPTHGAVRTTDNAYGGCVVSRTIEEFAADLAYEKDFSAWWRDNSHHVAMSLRQDYAEYLALEDELDQEAALDE